MVDFLSDEFKLVFDVIVRGFVDVDNLEVDAIIGKCVVIVVSMCVGVDSCKIGIVATFIFIVGNRVVNIVLDISVTKFCVGIFVKDGVSCIVIEVVGNCLVDFMVGSCVVRNSVLNTGVSVIGVCISVIIVGKSVLVADS